METIVKEINFITHLTQRIKIMEILMKLGILENANELIAIAKSIFCRGKPAARCKLHLNVWFTRTQFLFLRSNDNSDRVR